MNKAREAALRLCAAAVLVWNLSPADARAQAIATGFVSALLDVVGTCPESRCPGTTGTATELRVRAFAERRIEAGDHLRLELSGFAEALLADRGSRVTDGILRPQELYAELSFARAEVRVGFSRIVWGRLDELQPTDVVNPLDLTRFFLEGRSEARLPVVVARVRINLPRETTLDTLVVPVFRAGTFDELDEPTSPFNLLPVASLDRREPPVTWRNLQGGARLSTTTGRVDWAVCAYRGFGSFPLLEGPGVVQPGGPSPVPLSGLFPRFTMVGGDFETVRGKWGVRGEAAAFLRDWFQGQLPLQPDPGRSLDAGVGLDRKTGSYRVSGTVLVRRRFDLVNPGLVPPPDRTDLNLIASIDRTFARETRRLRIFGVYDPTEATAFLRGIFTMSLRDNLAVEASGGLFTRNGPDFIGQLGDRDFAYVRIKRYF
jgi:hypothetical protein